MKEPLGAATRGEELMDSLLCVWFVGGDGIALKQGDISLSCPGIARQPVPCCRSGQASHGGKSRLNEMALRQNSS